MKGDTSFVSKVTSQNEDVKKNIEAFYKARNELYRTNADT